MTLTLHHGKNEREGKEEMEIRAIVVKYQAFIVLDKWIFPYIFISQVCLKLLPNHIFAKIFGSFKNDMVLVTELLSANSNKWNSYKICCGWLQTWWNMLFWPKAQRWDQQSHSARTEGEKINNRTRRKHPTKLVKATACCLLSPLTTTTGWILRGVQTLCIPSCFTVRGFLHPSMSGGFSCPCLRK